MQKSAVITELIAGYDTYADVKELNVSAAAGAPATSWVCVSVVVSIRSSNACKLSVSAAASAISGITYEVTC